MLAELHPQLSFNQLVADLMKSADVNLANVTQVKEMADE